jgi:hypothetical protein
MANHFFRKNLKFVGRYDSFYHFCLISARVSLRFFNYYLIVVSLLLFILMSVVVLFLVTVLVARGNVC